jgi:microcystin-dependent protein
MPEPMISEIRMFAGNFPPNGWAFCSGQLMPISENDALFTILGTMYGGDGQETFALPNLQSRIPIHQGTGPDGVNYQIAEASGVESVTLTTQQIPVHTHQLLGTLDTATDTTPPTDKVLAKSTAATVSPYGVDNPLANMNAGSISPVGGSQPHENCQPFLCINYIISLFGVFPRFQ